MNETIRIMKQIDETIDAHDGWAMEQLHSMLKEQQKPITIESIDRLLKVQQPLFNLTHILLLFCSHWLILLSFSIAIGRTARVKR